MKQDIRQIKNHLRQSSKTLRRGLSPEAKEEMDSAIARAFLRSTSYTRSDGILTYVSTEIEVDTLRIIETALRDGKRVACPRCIEGTRNMDFYYIQSLDELSPGCFGVLEPSPTASRLFRGAQRPVCIVPGLSFDHWGYRLGYGKGYYDRFLAGYNGWTVGLCYSACIEYKYTRRCSDNRPRRLRKNDQ